MNPQPLNDAELMIVGENNDDIVLLEIIKGMNLEELRSFDVYTPLCQKHYLDKQSSWIRKEMQLLSTEKGRPISEDELIFDMYKNNNPERFRAFYVLKYHEHVKRIAVNDSLIKNEN